MLVDPRAPSPRPRPRAMISARGAIMIGLEQRWALQACQSRWSWSRWRWEAWEVDPWGVHSEKAEMPRMQTKGLRAVRGKARAGVAAKPTKESQYDCLC